MARLEVPLQSCSFPAKKEIFDQARPQVVPLTPTDGTIEVKPGHFTVIDCGAVLNPPKK